MLQQIFSEYFVRFYTDEEKQLQVQIMEMCISYLDNSLIHISKFLDKNIHLKVIDLMRDPEVVIQDRAIKIIGQIAYGNDHQVDIVLQQKSLIENLLLALQSNERHVRRSACYAISNFSAGNQNQIQILLNNNIVQHCIVLLNTDEESVRVEAVYAVCNTLVNASENQILIMMEQNLMTSLINNMLVTNHQNILIEILEALDHIFSKTEPKDYHGENFGILRFQQLGGETYLEQLQSHPKEEIYKLTFRLIEQYFPSNNI